jgi:hypothetical protein
VNIRLCTRLNTLGVHEDRVFPIKLGTCLSKKERKNGYEKNISILSISKKTMDNPLLLIMKIT